MLTYKPHGTIILTGGQKNMTKKVKKEHKYRVSIYLGKELYEQIKLVAEFLGLPIATTTKILLQTGYQIGNAMEQKITQEALKNGKSKI